MAGFRLLPFAFTGVAALGTAAGSSTAPDGEAVNSISDSIKRFFRPGSGGAPGGGPPAPSSLRRSNGLAEFCKELKGQEALRILDLGAASQANINFLIGQGHKVYSEDMYPALCDRSYQVVEDGRPHFDAGKFLDENLNYQMLLFDAVLCWDLFDQIDESLQRPLVERLHRVVKPGGILLSFFHTGEPGLAIPVHKYSICGPDSLALQPRGEIKLRRPLNNRNIENLFKDFHSLKFFLARDNLREVLIVR